MDIYACRTADSLSSSSSLYFYEGLTQSLNKSFAFAGRFPLSAFVNEFTPHPKENAPTLACRGVCAQNRNRTCTSLRTLDFESSASTNSAIWAGVQYYIINENLPKYDLGIFSYSNTPLLATLLLW